MDKKSFNLLVVFLVLLFVIAVSPTVFANGVESLFFLNITPSVNVVSKSAETKYISVYIGGAVLNEGWHEVPEGTRLFQLLDVVKPHKSYSCPYSLTLKLEDGKHYLVNYLQNGIVRYPVNVNSTMFNAFAQTVEVDSDVINLLLKRREALGGEFSSKEQILFAVGESVFSEIYYKLFIGEKA